MAHQRSGKQLEVEHPDNNRGGATDRAGFRRGRLVRCRGAKGGRLQIRERYGDEKEGLSENPVAHRDRRGKLIDNGKSPENSLRYHGENGDDAEEPRHSTLVAEEGGEGNAHGDTSNRRREESMPVFVKNSPDPFFIREKEHILPVGGRPIGDRKPRFMTFYQSADEDKEEAA